MTPDQLYPLETNPQTKEPFLRLRRHPNVILTPFRVDSDPPHLVPIFNDPKVCIWLHSPPFPFTLNDAKENVQRHAPPLDAILQELLAAQGSDELKIVNGSPVGAIREIQEDGTDKFIGNIKIVRTAHGELMKREKVDWKGAKDNMAINNALAVGDPNILWSFADYLAPSHHGRGIMTDAIDTLLNEWAIPRMNVHKMLVGTFVGNQGSVRVFEKNGFILTRTIDNHLVKNGKHHGVNVLEWTKPQVKGEPSHPTSDKPNPESLAGRSGANDSGISTEDVG